LRGKRLLLVLDNFEHLVEGAGLATDILQAAPEVKALVSSRVGLHVQGEHRFPVEGMAYLDQTSEVHPLSLLFDIAGIGSTMCDRI
jgi:predicted ATPase